MYRVHVEGSHGCDTTFSSREPAEAEVDRLRRSGLRAAVHPVHTPLPTNPWLLVRS